ncbi:MAG: hypothetical protein M0024_03300 [Nitrospiraceae bacterium]|nr:hypothetical protein [Nitrospiraceae bacterium]
MKILKALAGIFLSLRTAVWLSTVLIILLLAGGFLMPAHEEFQALQTIPLFQWLSETGLGLTWWLLAAIVVISLLAANTLACSAESLLRKKRSRGWLLTISPQLMHTGFLFILLAHLLSSYDSFQGMVMVNEGAWLPLPNGITASFDSIHADVGPTGEIRDWSASLSYYQNEQRISGGTIRPNAPSFIGGLGLYIKTVRPGSRPTALVQVSRDAGAPYALAGGILFLAGMTILLLLKVRRESDQD